MATNQDVPPPVEPVQQPDPPKPALSLDWWSVIVALALILLIWIGIIQSIPW